MSDYSYDIVLDFDGTVVKHRYPAVGEDIGAVPVLKRLLQNGHRLLLNTMRSHNSQGVDTLQPAIDWFRQRGITLYGVNENPDQREWTASPKVYGHLYIDDGALGAPLKVDNSGAPPFVDWSMASVYLFLQGLLTVEDVQELSQAGTITAEHQRLLQISD